MDAAADPVGTARWWISAASYGTAAALLGWCVFFGGGSGSGSLAALGTAAAIVAGTILVAAAAGKLPLPRLDRLGTIALVAAVLLVGWTGLTIWWSIAGDRSWDALRKALVYAAFAVIGLALAGVGSRSARSIAFIVSGVIGAALVWALVGKAIPALGPDDAWHVARLKGAVGYWNALALLGGAAIPLGLWLLTEVRGRLAGIAGALLVYAATLVVLLTQSRAGLIAAIAVTALWLALCSDRVEGALLALLAGVPGIVVAGWAFARSALVDDGAARADRVGDGAVLGILIVLGACLVVALVLEVPVARLLATRRQTVTHALVGGAALLVVTGAIGLVATVGNPFSWAADQIGRQGEVTNDPSRLRSLNTNNRLAWWGDAWQIFRAHPGGGTGARTFEIARKRYRDDASTVSEPHSVPIQLLADTGLPGFALGGVLAVFLALGLRASFRRLDGAERGAAAALVALPAAYAIHELVDYDLDFVAVTAPTVLVAAALLGLARPRARTPRGILAGLGIAAATAAVVYAIVVPALATRQVDAAYRQSDERQFARAASSARRAQGLNPLSPEPLWARATVADAAGDKAGAEAFYEQATGLQPENPATWYALGLYRLLELEDQCGAYQALNAAYTLDPKSSLWTPNGPLVVALDAVNAGACEKAVS